VAAGVGWCCSVPDLERQHGRLVHDLLLDRQPVQSAKQRLGIRSSRRLKHDPRGVVLHSLQLVIAVVDSRHDQTARQRLRQIRRRQMSDVLLSNVKSSALLLLLKQQAYLLTYLRSADDNAINSSG